MKINPNFSFQGIGHELVVKLDNGNDSKSIFLNETGTLLFNLIKENKGIKKEEIISLITDEFVISDKDSQEILDFIDYLIKEKIVID